MFYNILKHAHSGLRWVAILLLVIVFISALRRFLSKDAYQEIDRKFSLYALIGVHLQLVIGLLLYFISPKVQFGSETMESSLLRFYTVEHLTIMLIAIALVTIGYSRAKRVPTDEEKFRATLIFYGLGLALIIIGIPWPFRGLGAGWF